MEIKEFIEKVKKCKKSYVTTGSMGLKVQTDFEHKIWLLSIEENKICKCCGRGLEKQSSFLQVTFYNRLEHLTYFTSELLFMMYKQGKLPADYAQYHKCEAGKQFIENIKKIEVE